MTLTTHTDAARTVRNALSDPVMLCTKLGLVKGSRRQAGGLMVCCPVHGDRNPSCSVTRGPDGTVRARCFSCDWTADAIGMVAQAYGLETRGEQFREVLTVAAELAGLFGLVDELNGSEQRRERKLVPPPEPLPEPKYPEQTSVLELWQRSTPVDEDRECSRVLVARRLDPCEVALRDLARVLPTDSLPGWARYHGRDWNETGHRLVVRVFDWRGGFRSVRVWRVVDGKTPKRLPPAGRKASGLVLANPLALGMLRGRVCPLELCVVEGEPDWLVASTVWRSNTAVVGIGSGSWTRDHARRVPSQTRVTLATHNDSAGDRYAEQVSETLAHRCPVWRLSA